MTQKKVKYLLPAEKMDMGGFPIKQALPTQEVDQVDPFLLLHHGIVKYSPNRSARSQGVGPHPHRGFSPVTFVVEGEVHHRDSRGNSQVAKAGDVQWLSAGMGIIHSERPSDALSPKLRQQEIIQLWVNTPAEHKMDQPQYQHVSGNEMPRFFSADGTIENKLVVGNYADLIGKIRVHSEMIIIWGNVSSQGSQILHVPNLFNAAIYLIKGSARIEKYGVISEQNLAVFAEDGSDITMHFGAEAQFLLLSGKPIHEPIVRSGPFVMNTQTQILEAMRDYQMGKMGILIEEN